MHRLPLVAVALTVSLVATAGRADAVPPPPDGPSTFAEIAASLADAEKAPDDVIARDVATAARELEIPRGALNVFDRERASVGGGNDTPATAQLLRSFGTAPGQVSDARIVGALADVDGAPRRVGPFAEDDGAFPLAHPAGLADDVRSVRIAGTIGDGPHGTSVGDGSGDFDFFVVPGRAGDVLTVDVDAKALGSPLDAVVAVSTTSGATIAFNDDSPEIDSFLQAVLPADGDYLVAIAAFGALPSNPFDSGSGPGATTEGDYELTLSYEFAADVDVYRLDLRRGDVLGAGVTGAGRVLDVVDPAGELVMRTGGDMSANYPLGSPLRIGGNATVDHVVADDGPHLVVVSRGDGRYRLDLRVRRPALESRPPGAHQILFLDFDGATVDASTFGTPDDVVLSPLADFLGGWGLDAADEDALIDAVVATFTENMALDPRERGANQRFDVEIRSSRTDPDPWGQPNVTRIVIGGTVEQLGIPTVGLAESIDPGNFAPEETGVVLLDRLSAPAGTVPQSLNDLVAPGTDMVGFVGQSLGFVASHEAGHTLGNLHTLPGNGVTSIMDTFDITQAGLGPDGVFGTADDVDVDFVTDELFQGFVGTADTLERVAFAMSTPH